jgi:hypothetical protein
MLDYHGDRVGIPRADWDDRVARARVVDPLEGLKYDDVQPRGAHVIERRPPLRSGPMRVAFRIDLNERAVEPLGSRVSR